MADRGAAPDRQPPQRGARGRAAHVRLGDQAARVVLRRQGRPGLRRARPRARRWRCARRAGPRQQARDSSPRERGSGRRSSIASGVPLEVGSPARHDARRGRPAALDAPPRTTSSWSPPAAPGPGWSAYIPSFAPLKHTRGGHPARRAWPARRCPTAAPTAARSTCRALPAPRVDRLMPEMITMTAPRTSTHPEVAPGEPAPRGALARRGPAPAGRQRQAEGPGPAGLARR